jgi:hypothetical protein
LLVALKKVSAEATKEYVRVCYKYARVGLGRRVRFATKCRAITCQAEQLAGLRLRNYLAFRLRHHCTNYVI